MSDCKCSCSGTGGESSCATNAATKSVYACAGASNVGLISYDLGIELHKQAKYKLSCAVGVGADICGFTDAAKADDNGNLLIDGCPVGCLKQMFDNKGITNYDHIVVTEMGVKKEGVFEYDKAIIPKLIQEIDEMGL